MYLCQSHLQADYFNGEKTAHMEHAKLKVYFSSEAESLLLTVVLEGIEMEDWEDIAIYNDNGRYFWIKKTFKNSSKVLSLITKKLSLQYKYKQYTF